ncbi:MAG: YcfL family protein [Kiritimatiellaeota bacterium]|nr:YcfL family protein [Kiritimatiellota bacterium]
MKGIWKEEEKTRGFFRLAAAVLAVLPIMSCGHSVNTIENTDKSMKRDFVANKRVITDKTTASALQLRRIDSVTLPSGFLKIQAELRNAAKKTFQFSYRFLWFDNHGMLVETPAGTWIQKSIRSGDTAFISAVAPTAKCKDFQLKIIERK